MRPACRLRHAGLLHLEPGHGVLRARPRARRGHRRQTLQAGQLRFHLSGRRRPGQHRPFGDHVRRQPRRELQHHLRQQQHLRHDRRPDGPHHPRGHEGHHLPQRQGSRDRGLPHAHGGDDRPAQAPGLLRPLRRGHPGQYPANEKGHPQGLPEPAGRQGLLPGGDPLQLPHELGPFTAENAGFHPPADDGGIPPRRIQGQSSAASQQ